MKPKILTCLSKEAFENGIGAEDFLETDVAGDDDVVGRQQGED